MMPVFTQAEGGQYGSWSAPDCLFMRRTVGCVKRTLSLETAFPPLLVRFTHPTKLAAAARRRAVEAFDAERATAGLVEHYRQVIQR